MNPARLFPRFVAVASAFVFSTGLRAQVWVEEAFNYTAGGTYVGEAGGRGFSGPWATTWQGKPEQLFTSVRVSLPDPGKQITVARITGGKDRTWRRLDVERSLADIAGPDRMVPQPGRELWGSFWVQCPEAGAALVFFSRGAGKDLQNTLVVDLNNKETRLRLPGNGHRASQSLGAAPWGLTRVLFRIKPDIIGSDGGKVDEAAIWLDPDGGAWRGAPPARVEGKAGSLSFDTITLRMTGDAGAALFGELRLAGTAEEALGGRAR